MDSMTSLVPKLAEKAARLLDACGDSVVPDALLDGEMVREGGVWVVELGCTFLPFSYPRLQLTRTCQNLCFGSVY
jgi:hypothetical protein